jgi:hypothetical protein
VYDRLFAEKVVGDLSTIHDDEHLPERCDRDDIACVSHFRKTSHSFSFGKSSTFPIIGRPLGPGGGTDGLGDSKRFTKYKPNAITPMSTKVMERGIVEYSKIIYTRKIRNE